MNDDEKAYYEDWKRKSAATKARKKREVVEATIKADAKALADALNVSPGYRRIKSGRNKGRVVWRGSEQQRLDEIAIAKDRNREKEEARRAQKIIDREKTESLLQTFKEEKEEKKKEIVSPEILWAYIFLFSASIVSFLIAKLFASFGIMGLAVFIDFICYMFFAKKSRYSRYLPFLWWFLNQKK